MSCFRYWKTPVCSFRLFSDSAPTLLALQNSFGFLAVSGFLWYRMTCQCFIHIEVDFPAFGVELSKIFSIITCILNKVALLSPLVQSAGRQLGL